MEIAIGIQFSPREIRLETKQSAAEIRKLVEEAMEKSVKVIWLTDTRGKQVAIPTDKLAFIEIGSDKDPTPVGFAVKMID